MARVSEAAQDAMLAAFACGHPGIAYVDIYGKYAKLLPAALVGQLPEGPFCEVVALALDVSHADYALGTTMLFLKAGKTARSKWPSLSGHSWSPRAGLLRVHPKTQGCSPRSGEETERLGSH